MEYNVKPLILDRTQTHAIKKREMEAKEKEDENKEELKHKESVALKEKLNNELVVSNKAIVDVIESNTKTVTNALDSVKEQIANIKLDIPELVEGDKISSSIKASAKAIEDSIAKLSDSVAKIKLEESEVDMTPHFKLIADTITKNMDGLKESLSMLDKSINDISFVNYPPATEWTFDITRDEKGYISQVTATSPYEITNG